MKAIYLSQLDATHMKLCSVIMRSGIQKLFSSVDVYGASSNFNYEDVTITVVIVADIDYTKTKSWSYYHTTIKNPYTLKTNVTGNASESIDWLWSTYRNDGNDIVRLNDATYYVKEVKGKVVPVK